MHNISSKIIAAVAFLVQVHCGSTTGQVIYPDYEDGVIYARCTSNVCLTVPYDSSIVELNDCITHYGISEISVPFQSLGDPLDRIYKFRFDHHDQVDSLMASMQGMAFVEAVEYSPLFTLDLIPNDFTPTLTPYLERIDAPQAWDITTGSLDIVVAIIDNGVRLTHVDLKDKLWVNPGEIPGNGLDDDLNGYVDDIHGYDMADNDGNPSVPNSSLSSWHHGTHCAGIAAAESNNGVGVASIGYNTSIMALKCSPDSDSGNTLVNVYEAMLYATNNGADIISMSFGSPQAGLFTNEALVQAARNMGAIMVASAGNNGNQAPSYPAAYEDIISVGAVDGNDERATFSNYGATLDIMAPGTSIYSTSATSDNSYTYLSGTSMSCPMVAGTMALLRARFPNESIASLRERLMEGADPIDLQNPGESGLIGAGRLNAFGALTGPTPHQVEEIAEPGIHCYPNPASHELWVSCPNTGAYAIIGINGQEFLRGDLKKGQNPINLDKVPSGVYFTIITEHTTGKVHTEKFVVY